MANSEKDENVGRKKGINGRTKGQVGEREAKEIILNALAPVYINLGQSVPKLERNLMQSREGGYDIIGIDWLALEIKRQERAEKAAWWTQTKKQAKEGQTPFLMYRPNRTPWRCMFLAPVLVGPTTGPCGQLMIAMDTNLADGMAFLAHSAYWYLQRPE